MEIKVDVKAEPEKVEVKPETTSEQPKELNVPYMKIQDILDPDLPIVVYDEDMDEIVSLVKAREDMCAYLSKRVNELFKDKLSNGEAEAFAIYVTNDFIKRTLLNYRLEIIVNEKGNLQVMLGLLELMKRTLVQELRKLAKKGN